MPADSPDCAVPTIRCRGLAKRFGRDVAVCDVDLDVRRHEQVAVLGPSGCGKTTLLRLIAGFETPETGSIDIQSRRVVGPGVMVPPERRRVGLVFQDYALFPHLDVAGNVAFGLPRGAQRQRRVQEMLALVGLAGCEGRWPHELSGGQQQRVALARALAPRPDVLLLDEPFSNLDAGLRKQVRGEVREILRRAGCTAVFVTHDQEEAFYLGDRVAVMNAGRIEQFDTPETVFHRPATPFVAQFLGLADFLAGRVQDGILRTEAGDLPLAAPLTGPIAYHVAAGGLVQLMVRPDDLRLAADPRGNAQVVDRSFKGTHYIHLVRLDSGAVLHVMTPHFQCHAPEERVRVCLDAGHTLIAFADGTSFEVGTHAARWCQCGESDALGIPLQ